MCQYIAPCMIIGLNLIAIDKYNYMLFIFCSNPVEVHEWYRFELVFFFNLKKYKLYIPTKCEQRRNALLVLQPFTTIKNA